MADRLTHRHLNVLRALADGDTKRQTQLPDGKGLFYSPGDGAWGASNKTILDLMRSELIKAVGLNGSLYHITDAGRAALKEDRP